MGMRRIVLASTALLGSGLGLALAPAAAAAGGGGGGCHETSEGTGTAVEMVEMCFTPTVLRVGEGTTVSFANRDSMTHVVTGVGWGAPDLVPGAETSQRFDEPGTYPYSCYLHPTMNGVVIVGDGRGTGAVEAVATPRATTPTTATPTEQGSDAGDDDGSDGSAPVAAGMGLGGLAVGFGVAHLGRRRPA